MVDAEIGFVLGHEGGGGEIWHKPDCYATPGST